MTDGWRSSGADRGTISTDAPSAGHTRLSPTELDALLDTVGDCIFIIDAADQITRVLATGNDPSLGETIQARGLDPLLTPSGSQALREAAARSREHGQAERLHLQAVHTGRPVTLDARIRPTADNCLLCAVRALASPPADNHGLAARVEIERLLSQASYRFINLHPDRIDSAIDQTLADLGGYAGADRTYVYQLRNRLLGNTHGWCRPGITVREPAFGRQPYRSEIPWLIRSLYERDTVAIEDAAGLPAEAHRERSSLLRAGVVSMLAVPIIYSGTLQGFIGIERLAGHRSRLDDGERLLQGAGEIFASALQRKRSEQRIFRLAYYDRLTGLPNRQLLRRHIAGLCEQGSIFSLLLIDLNDAGTINDLLGHDVGDLLLKAVSARLRSWLPEGSILARWGGDEFMLSLPLCPRDETEAIMEQAAALQGMLSEPLRVAGHELRVTCSIGVANHPRHGPDVDSLLQRAELALRQAKRSLSGLMLYNQGLQRRAATRKRLETRLRAAVEACSFSLCYQPMVDAGTGQLHGAEALLRWEDAELGVIPPDAFISLAEETGLIIPIGEWLLEQVCQDLATWRQCGLALPRISVNVSAHQLVDGHLAQQLELLLERHDLPGTSLELEITESTLMESERSGLLQQLRRLGISVAVDDFGTGYSSLSKIKHMPVNILKIDRSFIGDLFTDPNDRAIVIAILAMAHQLNLRVVAEGVETEQQLAFLRESGCDLLQGYLLARPLDPGGFSALLRDGLPLPAAFGTTSLQ
ncbi:MAG: EAL domain-containing protein [Ectothiorhodospiraceae bacterium]|nr:EAL domain-containing protein [Ectothiorhodospiraceae bacterium]